MRTLGSSSLLGCLTDHPLVQGARGGEIGLGLLDVGAGTRQSSFGLRHVGTRDLADLEPVPRSLELALQALLVVERQIEHLLVTICSGVRVDAVEQCLLLEREQPGPLGLHLVLGLAHRRLRAAAGVEVLAEASG